MRKIVAELAAVAAYFATRIVVWRIFEGRWPSNESELGDACGISKLGELA